MTRRRLLVSVLFLHVLVALACDSSDPRERILIQRAAWKVDLLSWAAAEDGAISISARVSGPAGSELKQLTVRVELLDQDNAALGSEWETIDLSGIRRGGPQDVFIRLAPRSAGVEGLSVDTVPDPTPEEMTHLVELY